VGGDCVEDYVQCGKGNVSGDAGIATVVWVVISSPSQYDVSASVHYALSLSC